MVNTFRNFTSKVPFNFLFVVFSLASVASLFYFIFINMNPSLVAATDFVSSLTGARILRGGVGSQMYSVGTQAQFQKDIIEKVNGRVLPFKMLPTAALPFIPLTYFDYFTAYRILVFINVLLVLAVSYLLVKFLSVGNYYPFLLVSTNLAVVISVIKGQVTLFFLLIFILIWKYFNKRKSFEIGLLTSLFINRPQYLVFVPFVFLLSSEKKKFLSGFLLGTFIFIFITILLVGPEAVFSYPSFLIQTETGYYGSFYHRFLSLSPFLLQIKNYFNLPFVSIFVFNTLLYAVTVLYFSRASKRYSFNASFCAAILFTLIFGIHVWEHDLVLLSLPMIIFLEKGLGKYKNFHLSLSVILYFLLILRYIKLSYLIPLIFIFLGLWLVRLPKNAFK